MTTKNSPEAANLGAKVEDAGSEINVTTVPLSEPDAARLTEKIQLHLKTIADINGGQT